MEENCESSGQPIYNGLSLARSDWLSSKRTTALIDFDRTRHIIVQMIIISPNDLRATIADPFL